MGVVTDPSDDWVRMQQGARGRPVGEVEREYRRLIQVHGLRGVSDYHVELTARVLSDGAWVRHHPVDTVRFCWRHRRQPGALATVRALSRPRFAG